MGDATVAGKVGGFARREQEWAYQSNTIAAEIGQIFKQLRAAEIRRRWLSASSRITRS